MAAGLALLNNQAISVSGTLNLGPQPPVGNAAAPQPTGLDPGRVAAIVFQFSTGASAAGTFNLYAQHSIDGGTNWTDFVSFSAVTTSAVGPLYTTWVRDLAIATPSQTTNFAGVPKTDATLAAGSVIMGPNGDNWRLKWVVTAAWSANVTLLAKYVLKTR